MTTSVVLYFHVHQPYRLKLYSYFDIGRERAYFDDRLNEKIVRRVAERSYIPVTQLLRRAVDATDGRFRCAFSITGTVIEQLERWAPDALRSFQDLVATRAAEVVAETSHHSLAAYGDLDEFRAQVASHADRIASVFGSRPTSFRNTELVFDDGVARAVEGLGFEALLGEGADRLLRRRSTHLVRRPLGCERLGLLLRDYRRSDDIAFRFADRARRGDPLTAAEFAASLNALPRRAQVACLFMDFETAGEHQHADSGILRFFEALPAAVLAHRRLAFATPTEAVRLHPAQGEISAPDPVSWADQERDLTAWLGNDMQRSAHDALYEILPVVRRSADAELLDAWRRLSTSDHVYYMCTKWFSDGDVHKYFSPYDTPHAAFVAFMNAVDDLARRSTRRSPRTGRRALRKTARRRAVRTRNRMSRSRTRGAR